MKLLRRLAAALGAAALLAGCGGGGEAEGDPQAALSDTAAKLGEIRSGKLDFRLVLDPEGEGERVGFELAGPFALGDETHGPRFRLDYTQLRGDAEGTVTMTSTGEQVYVTVGNETYELPSDRASELTGAGAVVAGDGLGSLDVGRWLLDPELSAGDEVAGDATDRIEARLDVAAAVRDLVALARKAGASLPALGPAEARRLAEAADEATIEVLTGRDDRLLRRLAAEVAIGFEVPAQLESLLGDAVGATIDFELRIAEPNEPVTIDEPADARPASEYPG